jgi:predicted ArsR family transcriptional regulator
METASGKSIKEYLDKHPLIPARTIAKGINLSITDVRYHLQRMVVAGEIEAVSPEASGSAGRPARLYRLHVNDNSNAIQTITAALLRTVELANPMAPWQEIAAGILPESVCREPSFVVRVTKAIQFLNTLSYQAHWEARPNLPRVEFRQCPYANLVRQTPQLCAIDQVILEAASGCRVSSLRLSSQDGNSPCVFQIHLNEKPAV